MAEQDIRIAVGDGSVSALWRRPPRAFAALLVAHGAGAGMRHRFLADVAAGLAERGVATLRYQFPYMEAGRGRPDTPAVAVRTVRAAAAKAAELAGGLPLFAGGKSFGGRMTSTAEAEEHLGEVAGLVFFGFPLHPPGKPGTERATHLFEVEVPMLFLQGTRDSFAETGLVGDVCRALGERARLVLFADADHSFRVPKASGRTDAETLAAILDETAGWIGQTAG